MRLKYDPHHDYYDLLGVTQHASSAEIQRAYRERAKELHPDRNPERQDWATESFQQLNDAYRVLTDQELRRQYNDLRWPHLRHTGGGSPGSPGRPPGGPGGPLAWDWPNKPPPSMYRRSRGYHLRQWLRSPYTALFVVSLSFCMMGFLSMQFFGGLFASDLPDLLRVSPTPRAQVVDADCASTTATIVTPREGAAIRGALFVTVGIFDNAVTAYRLELAPLVERPGGALNWTALAESDNPTRGVFTVEDIAPGAAGRYVLRLAYEVDGAAVLPPCTRQIQYTPSAAGTASPAPPAESPAAAEEEAPDESGALRP